MIVAAHPDDIETTSGGTVALLKAAGADVMYVLTTNGDKGFSKNTSLTSMEVAFIRYGEQQRAGAVLGVKNIAFLDYEDGALSDYPSVQIKEALVTQIRIYKPDFVFTWAPTYNYELFQFGLEHTDHKTTGERTIDSVYPSARDYLAFPNLWAAGLKTHKVSVVYLFHFLESKSNTFCVDISSVMDLKIRALLEHKSQYENANQTAQDVKNLASLVGSFTPFQYAEMFIAIPQLS